MRYCHKCSNEQDDGQFCQECGGPLADAPVPVVSEKRGDTGLDRSTRQTVQVNLPGPGGPDALAYDHCLIDGRVVRRDGTFRCRQCGRAWLCLEHLDAGLRVCEECAAEIRGGDREARRSQMAALLAEGEAHLGKGHLAAALLAGGRALALDGEDPGAGQLAEEGEGALRRLQAGAEEARESLQEARAEVARLEAELDRARVAQQAAGKEREALSRRLEAAETSLARWVPVWKQIGIEMVNIPEGSFLYGKNRERVRQPEYYLARTLVTNLQYQAFAEATDHRKPSHWQEGKIPGGREEHPVVGLKWDDAEAFCRWAGCRLPTEREWEKGARSDDGREFPWGNEWESGRCNSKEAGIGDTTAVDRCSSGASPYGLLDMAGNVWEWCDGWRDSEHKRRVLRGGSWMNQGRSAGSANRSGDSPKFRYDLVGFRCSMSPTPSP